DGHSGRRAAPIRNLEVVLRGCIPISRFRVRSFGPPRNDERMIQMPDLADLYPGFASEWIDTSSGRVFARVGGKGPPLLLLHGFSETHVMWHRVAPALADKFALIIADLPGYGWSDMPRSDEQHLPYSKRAMAKSIVEAMGKLGHVHFALAGHDRGG